MQVSNIYDQFTVEVIAVLREMTGETLEYAENV